MLLGIWLLILSFTAVQAAQKGVERHGHTLMRLHCRVDSLKIELQRSCNAAPLLPHGQLLLASSHPFILYRPH